MITKKIVLKEEHGLHARPALKLALTCQRFESEITICKGCEKANGCSILELMLLGGYRGEELEVVASGKDENEAIKVLTDFFDQGSGI